MKGKEKEMVIPRDFNLPKEVSEVRGQDGKPYLQFNTGMLTLYKQTYGELSRFFMALREARLIGSRCKTCGQVMVPAASWHCPNCNFAEMEEVALPHRGVLAATAPITFFPSASFVGQAPFCRGYVDVATEAKIASFLPCRLRTTTGIPRPGIFVKGLELKLVFEDKRQGTILDIFGVPMVEIPKELRKKEPLLASALNLKAPPVPKIKAEAALKPALASALKAMQGMAAKIKSGTRAEKDLAGRKHVIKVKTGGGEFDIKIERGKLAVNGSSPRTPAADFTMTVENPAVFSKWVAGGSLSDAVMEGELWLPNLEAFPVLYALDRLPRSIRRDQEEK
ncbi:MAG: zinc ribbon domain-containing protein [candidate division Zixibacteria bacterium]|nr:zinc ribbon domain-containing protein [candidate division Zixibacteria bacterium]